VPLSETLRPLGVSSWLRACPSVSGSSVAVGPRNNVPAGPPSHSPWASNPNSELRVKPYRDTPIVSFSQTFTHCCTYLQRCQSQQQQMNVYFQRFNGCHTIYAALWGKTRPVTSTESDTKILQSTYFAYKVGIISFYSSRMIEWFYLNKKVGGIGFAFDVFCVTLLFLASQSLLVLNC